MIRAGIRRLSPSLGAGRAPRGTAERPSWPRPVVIALLAIACAAVIIPLARHKGSTTESSAALTSKALSTVDRVPQSGVFLGSARAPAQLAVYADLTSLRWADFQEKVLPTLVSRYVRPGRLRLQFATVAPASSRLSAPSDAQQAAQLAQAAGLQNRLWLFSGVFAAQYVGVLDVATATQILRAVPGLDRRRALADRDTARVKAAVARNTEGGQAMGAAKGGLAFAMTVNGGGIEELPLTASPAAQIAAIDHRVGSLPARPGPAPAAKAPPKPAPVASTATPGQPAAAAPCASIDTATATETVACTTATARLTIVPQGLELPLPGLRARVLAIQSIPATSASGKARHRVRLVVRLRARNVGDQPLFGGDQAGFVYLVLGKHKIGEDRHVWPLPVSFKQNQAIAPGETRTGVLRFEIGGADGEYLQRERAGQIGIRPTDQPGAGGKVPVGVIRFSTG